MCGRFVRVTKPSVYASMFEVANVPAGPSHNIAPTQPVAVVRTHDEHRECVLMRWGMIPFWSKDGKNALINARAETVVEKPAFRNSLKKRRCLVLADGYFEWRTEGKQKHPFLFHLKNEQPFAFAGLWDCWKGGAEPVEACTIITTEANALSRPIHDRMPAILTGDAARLWLDPDVDEPAVLQELLKPYPAGAMDCYPVSPLVNNVRNNSPDCIARVQAAG